jgi:2-keto-4-pentenoate hydratase/2-oxohepta-3-ene-1,7-dioic acid hydratase in catechol pathway
MQDGNTSDLLFSIADLIAIISAEVTLDPGDVIITGTPSGVGVFREPQVFLEPGDLVRVEVERIGSLTNPIPDEDGNAPAGSPAARFMAGA